MSDVSTKPEVEDETTAEEEAAGMGATDEATVLLSEVAVGAAEVTVMKVLGVPLPLLENPPPPPP